MSPRELIEEEYETLKRERSEWLQAIGSREEDVQEDREDSREFIFSAWEDEDCHKHLTRIFLPHTLQTANIYLLK